MKQVLHDLIKTAAEKEYNSVPEFVVERPRTGQSDYATNLGFVLAKSLKKNPQEISQALSTAIKAADTDQVIADMQIAGGFINIFLADQYLAKYINTLAKKINLPQIGLSQDGKPRKVVFEYSSPNTNKPLHIGHTRNDVYGRACINLLKAVGFNVVSMEIINDRGIHIMKSVLMYMKHGQGQTPESAKAKPDHFVGKFYQMFAQEAAVSEEVEKQLLTEAQELLQKWENNDAATRKVWQQMNQWFFEGVKQTYEREGSTFDEVQFESEIYDKGREIVLDGVAKGIFQKEADGSVSIDLEDQGLGKKYLLRKDGTTLYMTQDLYLWNSREEKHHPDLAIVTTAAEQTYHFQVLSHLFKLIGYPWAEKFKHLPYEFVYLGKNKLSSREGNTISADDLVETVKQRVRDVMAASEKLKVSGDNDKIIEAVAFGAIKYGYLKYEPGTRIYFDPEQTISLEGNTGPYVQYAHARIRSIMKKAGTTQTAALSAWTEPAEKKLIKQLLYYSDVVADAARDYKPNLLANYLYELAGTFNNFYSEVRVLDAESPEVVGQRLQLLAATANVLAHGLNLLGIEAVEEM